MWNRIQHAAFVCRFGRIGFAEYLRRSPEKIELALFEIALQEILEHEYESKPPELRHED